MSAQCPDCLRRRTSSTRPSRDHEAERLGGLEVDHHFVFNRCLHRQVGRLLALEDAIDITGRLPVLVDLVRPSWRVTSRGPKGIVFRDHSPSFARLPGECWIPVPLPPPRTKKLIYLAFLSFSSYEFLRTFRGLDRRISGQQGGPRRLSEVPGRRRVNPADLPSAGLSRLKQ